MNRMGAILRIGVAAFAALLVASILQAGQPQLTIMRAEADQPPNLGAGTILIQGYNFVSGNETDVAVILAGETLRLISIPTATEIVAELPAGYLPGTYLLTVSRGNGSVKNDTFNLTIGAAGPAGPQGPPGARGPEGPAGSWRCHPGDFLGCYTGPEGTLGVGVCTSGKRTCDESEAQFSDVCEGEIVPSPEACGDGLDNDCDGQADENCQQQTCVPGQSRACYTGPPETADVGVCRLGSETCNQEGTAFGACEGVVLPSAETCDGLDNDCNGEVDEGCSPTNCQTDSDCPGTAWCSVELGFCFDDLANGQFCSRDAMCQSNRCVSFFCVP